MSLKKEGIPLPLILTPLSNWPASGGVVAPLDERGRPRPSGVATPVENELNQVARSGAVAAPPGNVGALTLPL